MADKKKAYIPKNTILNYGVFNADPPKTKYDDRKFTLDRDEVRKNTGGNNGKKS